MRRIAGVNFESETDANNPNNASNKRTLEAISVDL
jgi:hypothetical protein